MKDNNVLCYIYIDDFYYIKDLKTFYASLHALGLKKFPDEIIVVGKTKCIFFEVIKRYFGMNELTKIVEYISKSRDASDPVYYINLRSYKDEM